MTHKLQKPLAKGQSGLSTLWLAVVVSGLLLAIVYGTNTATNQAIQFGSRGDIRNELDNAVRSAVEIASTLLVSNQIQIEGTPGTGFEFKLAGNINPGDLEEDIFEIGNDGTLKVKICNSRLEMRADPNAIVNPDKRGDDCGDFLTTTLRVDRVQEIVDDFIPATGQPLRVRFALVRATSEQDVSRGENRPRIIRSQQTARLAVPDDPDANCRFARNEFYNELTEFSLGDNQPTKLGWVGVNSFTGTDTVRWQGGQQRQLAVVQAFGKYTPLDKYYDGDPNTLQFKLLVDGTPVYAEIPDVTDDAVNGAGCKPVLYAPRGNSFNGGCFTPETRITMADGSQRPVAEIRPGDRVKDPMAPGGRLVTQMTRGLETKPLIVIQSEHHKLVVTQKHPIFTARGLVTAKELTPQDRIEVPGRGWQAITSLSTQATGPEQWVYNLELAGDGDNINDHALIAEGLIVGDHHLQKELEESNKSNSYSKL